jgi:hypothetical protein
MYVGATLRFITQWFGICKIRFEEFTLKWKEGIMSENIRGVK